mgnify:CR=1 FL=1|jgi:hypothetical protein
MTEQITDEQVPANNRRGKAVLCEECGFITGRNMLHRTEGLCWNCDHDMRKQENYKL